MVTLKGKYKNNEWEVVDEITIDPDTPEKEQRAFFLSEYVADFGQGWMFKWDDE